MRKPPVALTIAGSDPSGGAGIQADLKVFQSLGVHGTSVITSVTAQNTVSIREALDLPASIIRSQLETLLEDFEIKSAKTGMLSSAAIVKAISDVLSSGKIKNLVIDPAMMSKSRFP